MAIHIIPENDSQPHEELTTCHCHPRVDFTQGVMVVIHNSFDGRELLEQAQDLLNTKGAPIKSITMKGGQDDHTQS
jgi:hypothetical protein